MTTVHLASLDELMNVDEPFGELHPSFQLALFDAWLNGQLIEYELDHPAKGKRWVTLKGDPTWNKSVKYRVKQIKKTPDSINWDHVHPAYNWMARDRNGYVFLYKNKPELFKYQWSSTNNNLEQAAKPYIYNTHSAGGFNSLTVGTVDWKDSLVQRPGT